MTMRKFGVGEVTEIDSKDDSKKEATAKPEWTSQDQAELREELSDSDSDKTEGDEEA